MNPSSLFSISSKRKRDPNSESHDDEPNSCKRPKNDVFMNYSFEDIGKSFISHLKGALNRSSFTIYDHTMLPVGQDAHLQLLKAIEESDIYVLVFSPNYASSRRRLDELVDIMDRFNKHGDRKVVPVFFKVKPSHVRSQQGSFIVAFQAHNTNVHPNRVQEWRRALKEAGQLSGLTLQNGDEANFVKKVVKNCLKWLHEGSRIIVTTRDKRSLGDIPYASYHTRLLNRRESLNLFTRLMFERDDHVYTKFITEIAGRAGGHPLVLKVWRCHFKQYGREQWPSISETLKVIPHGDVQKQLRISYDSLSNRAKKLFLDIACFFDGLEDKELVKVLEDEDPRFFPNNEIQYLVDKSLVEITSDNRLQMHHVIREMGCEIVRQENEDEPGKRTRLWDQTDVKRVLTECSGTEYVESIRLEWLMNMQKVTTLNALRKMSNLRLIRLWGYDYYQGDIFYQSDEMNPLCFRKLKYMYWQQFPLKSLDNIDMCNVVLLYLKHSKLETLWEGIKSLKKLRILDVSCSSSLTKTGNFSGLENLEELYLHTCRNLKELHSSIGYLQKLAILDIRSSIPLKSVPWEMINKLASLRKLIVGHIDRNMELEFDEADDPMLYLYLKECPITNLEFHRCNISNISGGEVSLASLKHLYLYKTKFYSHPNSLLQLHALNTFKLERCNHIQSIPNLPGNVTSIKACECASLLNLPCNISELKSLTVLDFEYCPKLGTEDPDFLMKVTGLTNLTHLSMRRCSVSQVPSDIGNLVSLKKLNLSSNTFSSLPDHLSNLSQLVSLSIVHCERLQLLPLLPSNLKYIDALSCRLLDVKSSASIRTKVCKDSPLSNRFMIRLPRNKEVPEWCSYQSRGDVLSFVAPDNNICGIILCINIQVYISGCVVPKMYNETKNTSHRLKTKFKTRRITTNASGMFVMCYPLDDTTLVVESGDSVVLKFRHGWVSSCGLRLIYESDVVDSKLILTEPTPHIPSDGYSCSGYEDYSSFDDEDYSSSNYEDKFCSNEKDYSCSDYEDYSCSDNEVYSCSDYEDDSCSYEEDDSSLFRR